MIELIIVIVVAGILAAVMLPRLERDAAREAAEQVAKHIRYTQHLSMVNDVYDANDNNWFQNRWSINLCSPQYRVSRVNNSETAIDPMSKVVIDGATTNSFDLASRYGITTAPINATNCMLTFDNLGRPYLSSGVPTSATASLMGSDINVSITDGTTTYQVTVTEQTGYTFVNY